VFYANYSLPVNSCSSRKTGCVAPIKPAVDTNIISILKQLHDVIFPYKLPKVAVFTSKLKHLVEQL
jgi:hypothetical protein